MLALGDRLLVRHRARRLARHEARASTHRLLLLRSGRRHPQRLPHRVAGVSRGRPPGPARLPRRRLQPDRAEGRRRPRRPRTGR
ncbi:MAG: hypothetical protein MZU84_04110 [Sphingobacterium sp.]|nr:hypothetical protein [Sphingobacterium sp.]